MFLAGLGDLERGRKALTLAANHASLVEWDWGRAERLTRVAAALFAAGEISEAERVWDQAIQAADYFDLDAGDNGQDSYDCASVQVETVQNLLNAGYRNKAEKVANAIKFDIYRDRAIKMISEFGKG